MVEAAGVLAYFPEYRGLGQGYFDVDKDTFDPFLLKHGKSPLHLLYLGRLFQVMVITSVGIIIFYLLSHLIGERKGIPRHCVYSPAPHIFSDIHAC